MPPGIGYSTQDLDQEALQRSFQTPKPRSPLSDPWAAGLTPTQAGVQTDAPSRDPWDMGVMSPGGPVQPLSGGGPMPPSPPPVDPHPSQPPKPLSDPSWQPAPAPAMGGVYDPGGTYQFGGGTTPAPTSLGGLYDPGGRYQFGGGVAPPNPGQIEEPMALSDPRWRPDWNGGRSLLLQRLFGGL